MMRKKKRIQLNRILLCAFICVWISVSFSTTVYAGSYNSWTEGSSDERSLHGGTGSELFDENNSYGTDELIDQMTKDNSNYFEVQICKLINGLSFGIAAVERASRMQIDTIVLGRVAKNASVNSFGFDLSDGNLYGSLGSMVYAALRNFMFGVFGIYFLYMMLAYLIKGTGTSRANLKDALYNFLFVYALLYAIPIAVDYLLLFRDGMLKIFIEKAISVAEDFNFVDIVLMTAADETRILYSLLALCFVCGSVWLGFNYLKIALQQAYLFGIFPIVAFRSFSDKNILNKWFSYFFANALVPLFDCIGFVMLIYELRINPSSSLAGQFMALVIFFSIIPSRNLLIQLFGGPVPGRGFSIIPMALMAARLLGRGRGGATPSGGTNGTGNGNGGNASSGNGGNGSGTGGNSGSGSGGSTSDGSINNPNNSSGGNASSGGSSDSITGASGDSSTSTTPELYGDYGSVQEEGLTYDGEPINEPISESENDAEGEIVDYKKLNPMPQDAGYSDVITTPEVADKITEYDAKSEEPDEQITPEEPTRMEKSDMEIDNDSLEVDSSLVGSEQNDLGTGNASEADVEKEINTKDSSDLLSTGVSVSDYTANEPKIVPTEGSLPRETSFSPPKEENAVQKSNSGSGLRGDSNNTETAHNDNGTVQNTETVNTPRQQAVETASQTNTTVSNEVANKYEQHSNDPSASMGVRIARNTSSVAKRVGIAGAAAGATLGFAATAISGDATTMMSGAIMGGLAGGAPGGITASGANKYIDKHTPPPSPTNPELNLSQDSVNKITEAMKRNSGVKGQRNNSGRTPGGNKHNNINPRDNKSKSSGHGKGTGKRPKSEKEARDEIRKIQGSKDKT